VIRVIADQRVHPGSDDAVELATVRYQAAFAKYQFVVGKNAETTMIGGTPSWRARRAEERAFDELDSARHALFTAAAVAFPTIH
jgi:hypothetical protein